MDLGPTEIAVAAVVVCSRLGVGAREVTRVARPVRRISRTHIWEMQCARARATAASARADAAYLLRMAAMMPNRPITCSPFLPRRAPWSRAVRLHERNTIRGNQAFLHGFSIRMARDQPPGLLKLGQPAHATGNGAGEARRAIALTFVMLTWRGALCANLAGDSAPTASKLTAASSTSPMNSPVSARMLSLPNGLTFGSSSTNY